VRRNEDGRQEKLGCGGRGGRGGGGGGDRLQVILQNEAHLASCRMIALSWASSADGSDRKRLASAGGSDSSVSAARPMPSLRICSPCSGLAAVGRFMGGAWSGRALASLSTAQRNPLLLVRPLPLPRRHQIQPIPAQPRQALCPPPSLSP